MNSCAGILNMKIVLVVFQLLGMASAEFGTSSGRFAVVQRRNGFAEDTQTSLLLRFRQRRSFHDCNYANYNDDTECLNADHNHDTIFQSDDQRFQAPEGMGRFAKEYEHERNMIRSAENAHIRQQQQTVHDDNTDETKTVNSAHRMNPAAIIHSTGNEYEARQRRCASRYDNNNPIFT
jgi:hypothetical protein